MQEKADTLTGEFRLVDGREVFGTLRIAGEKSSLSLFDDNEFPDSPGDYSFITGELHNGKRATLFECALQGTAARGTAAERRRYSATCFPHYVALGYSYLSATTPCISRLHFVMKDISAVFYDINSFSTVRDPKPFIQLLKNDMAKIREIEIGDHPIIAYFAGDCDIAAVDTILGVLRVHHLPSYTAGGPEGVGIDNKIGVTLTPQDSLTFREGIDRLSALVRFFELILGREQPLVDLSVNLHTIDLDSPSVDIHRSYSMDLRCEEDRDGGMSLGPRDALISIVDGKEQFSKVIRNYLGSYLERRDCRARLQNSINNGHLYTIDRIIAAANNFDIFPKSAYPEKVPLSKELTAAKTKARELFRALPDSIERSSMLSAIGRIGELSLKRKIRHRVTSTGLDKHFPKLVRVLEEAVNCRNHYVHGSPGRIDYSSNFDLVCFFTDCLEFSFAASDLIDAGWDISLWMKNYAGYLHAFGRFRVNYGAHVKHFEEAMCSAG